MCSEEEKSEKSSKADNLTCGVGVTVQVRHMLEPSTAIALTHDFRAADRTGTVAGDRSCEGECTHPRR